ncbi:hypothetical protein PMAYCL1PPCAC_01520, partial [Pristionchus mayeri]
GTWINAVRSTSEGRKVLMKLLNTSTNRFLCASHFDPSDFIYHPTRVALKSNAVPFFETVSVKNVSQVNDIGLQKNSVGILSKLRSREVREVKEETIGIVEVSELRTPLFDNQINENPIEFKEEPVDDLLGCSESSYNF